MASINERTDFVCGAAFNAPANVMPALSVPSGMPWLPVALDISLPFVPFV